ncbi:galactan beta-1,4-galactosyltransferase GALS3-like [Magnolia sinica]|uniref:galactan beta-1,4-galactosyltransferase GALS3-like n=1 Tax=Magnolia sinica TaxID=86752 RepID=UPI00265A15CE|nr:galactan beta-1,4-galactosyltransferase GALS3-like [Magnolia sinica]
MAKERDPKEKRMFVGIVWNCAEMKLLVTALFLLCSIATFLQFFPSRPSISSPFDFNLCLSKLSSSPSLPTLNVSSSITQNVSSSVTQNVSSSVTQNMSSSVTQNVSSSVTQNISSSVTLETHQEEAVEADVVGPNGIIKRSFNPYGWAAYLFIQMGAYRGGLDTFAVIGLSSKPIHVYGKPSFQCEWAPSNISQTPITVPGKKFLPDWGYGHIYTVVVVNCTFPAPVGADGSGGRLILHAFTGPPGPDQRNETIVTLTERPGSLDTSIFTARPKYDYLYCGSSLYGSLSPQRMREWIAYHVKLFGERSHFIIHDAGGVHPEVLEVLKPWMELGYVTLQDITDQERFDGYYHNQFLVVNDCLHRYRFMAKWMFFFDVDEYIFLPPKSTIQSLLLTMVDYTQFTIEQMPMSNKLCLESDRGKNVRMWGFEKLVYKDVKRGIRRDRKYAVQPRQVFATGVHMSQNVAGKTTHKTERRIKYFHYHGTIANRREPCREFVSADNLTVDGTPYVLDGTLRATAASVKRFELKTIGPRLQRTRQ